MENSFKVGDWIVTPNKEIVKILQFDTLICLHNVLSNGALCFNGYLEVCTLWKPKHKEWCYFFDKKSGQKSFRVSQFNHIAFGKGREGMYKDMQGNYYDTCIPFGVELEILMEELTK